MIHDNAWLTYSAEDLKELEKLGVEDGDTVKLYELQFEYFK